MKIIIYSTKALEKKYITSANRGNHELFFVSDKLSLKTADKAKGYQCVSCLFADYIDEQLMTKLAENGVTFITLRSAGYNYAGGAAAKEHNNLLLKHLESRHNQLLSLKCA
ncbi:MAG: hypothetical protein K2X39_06045 [Silvanigrellaceae bacterium]|nr:hypothetical protein [Silvanigrellaceae bacterium]